MSLKALLTLHAMLDMIPTVRFHNHRELAGLLEHIVDVMCSLYEPYRWL